MITTNSSTSSKKLLMLLVLFCMSAGLARAEVTIPFSGMALDADGNPIDDTVYIKALFCDESNQSAWSIDSLANNCTEPTSSSPILADNGFFNINIGDTSIEGMPAIADETIIDGGNLTLHLWMATSENGNFEKVGTVPLVTVPNATDAKYWQGNVPDDFVRWDQSIPSSMIDTDLSANQLAIFPQSDRAMVLGANASASNVMIQANITGGLNNPALRYNSATFQWEYSNDGVTYNAMTAGGGVNQNSVYNWTNVHNWNSFVTNTGNNLTINTTLGDDADNDNIAGIGLNMTSAATGDADSLNAIFINNLGGADAGVTETAVRIGANWDNLFEFEGSAIDANQTFFRVINPTADQVITFPNATGTVALSTGNVATASALAADPSDCAANQLATGIASNGNLTCSGVTNGMIGANAVDLGTQTAGNYVASVATNAGLTGGAAGSEGATLTLGLDYSATLAANPAMPIGASVFDSTDGGLLFEGGAADANEGALVAGAITADRTWTLPDASGTIALTSDITGDISDVTAGAGLTGGAASGAATVDVGAGNGILANANDVALNLDYSPTWTNTHTFSLAGAERINISNSTYTGSLVGALSFTVTPDTAAGQTTYAMDLGLINSDDNFAESKYLMYAQVINNATTQPDSVHGISLQTSNISAAGMADMISINNQSAGQSVTDGIVMTSNAGGITDAIDVSDANIVNALNAGDNPITGVNLTFNSSSRFSFNMPDNVSPGYALSEGANNYFAVNTSNGTEAINFGNAVTNPKYIFIGSGGIEVGGTSIPGAADTLDLGSTAREWNQIFMGDGAGVSFGIGQNASIGYNNVNSRLEVGGTNANTFFEDKVIYNQNGIGIADNTVGATPAPFTLNPQSNYVLLTCNDPDGCTITMDEASAISGTVVTIVTNSVNTNTFADTGNVSELNGQFVAGIWDSITLLYANDRWVETGRSNN